MDKRCSKCGFSYSTYTNDLYKFDNEIYCAECLIDKLGLEENTITSYSVDDVYLGNDDNFYKLMDNICEHFEVAKVRSD